MESEGKIINHAHLLRLAKGGSLDVVWVVGEDGGWHVRVEDGDESRVLVTKRGEARKFRRFESLTTYLRDMGVVRYCVDASSFDPQALPTRRRRLDSSARLKQIHHVAARLAESPEA